MKTAISIICILLFLSSCCPKITNSTTETTTHDTVYTTVHDTVLAHSADTFRTGINADSLVRLIRQLQGQVISQTLSETNSNGVRARIVYRDSFIYAECNIDSLRVAIEDSMMQVFTETRIDNQAVVYECPYFKNWMHSKFLIIPILFFAAFGIFSFGIWLAKNVLK